MNNICFQEDDFTRELQDDRATALWKVKLSDGSIATMDDGRPGEAQPSAWIRLGEYIRERKLRIVKLWLKFRDNVDENMLPENAEGYFFSKNAIGDVMGGSNTLMFYIVGAVVGGKLTVMRYSSPSLILVDVEEREMEKLGETLIRNPECQSEIGNQTP